MPHPETYLNEHELAARLACSVAMLRAHRRKGTGCPYLKVGRLVRYKWTDVEAFLAASKVGGTA